MAFMKRSKKRKDKKKETAGEKVQAAVEQEEAAAPSDAEPDKETPTPQNPPGKKQGKFDAGSFSASSVKKQGPVMDQDESAKPTGGAHALGQVLEEAGVVDHDMIRDLVSSGNESAQSLRRSMIQQGLVNEQDILNAVADQAGMEKTTLRGRDIDPDVLALVEKKFVKNNNVLPIEMDDNEVTVAVSDPTNLRPLDDLRVLLGKEVKGVLVNEEELQRYIMKYYESDEINRIYDEFSAETKDPFEVAMEDYETIELDEEDRNQPPVVRFVDLIFRQAVHEGASDIHIEPQRGRLMVRFRIDGVLHELPSPPSNWQNAILSRLKVMSNMDLAEKRVPQDGRIKLTLPDKSLDLRVSCLPSIFGETIVMRILDQSDVLMGLEDVGFLPDSVKIFEKLIRQPNGIILMTGPTGSGKTTTLNAALNTLNSPEEKIITAEDPVEYMMQGINQIQINAEVDLTFSTALRSMLRMSPDIIMVGEIRDFDTAEIAIRAALTGHLVFSTLHTNDAPSACTRLIDMGVKPFLVASSIQAVIAQRLIRRICDSCKHDINLPDEAFRDMGVSPEDYRDSIFYKGAGCDRCGDTGYRGRTAIHEIFVMDSELRKMVIRAESTMRLKRAARQRGMRTLRLDGWEKVLLGQTTAEEVMRITQMD